MNIVNRILSQESHTESGIRATISENIIHTSK
jgi:hypothetical protein